MLIIAAPKSASTSLRDTIAARHRELDARQDPFHFLEAPEDFPLLARWHSCIREYDEVERFFGGLSLFKQHIPPTRQNILLLAGRRKVVLLREPRGILAAYQRAFGAGVHVPRPEFQGVDDWEERAEEIGLADEIRRFVEGWQGAADGETAMVWYSELMENPEETVRSVEEFFALDPPEDRLKLVRSRYSRDPVINWLRRSRHRVRRALQR